MKRFAIYAFLYYVCVDGHVKLLMQQTRYHPGNLSPWGGSVEFSSCMFEKATESYQSRILISNLKRELTEEALGDANLPWIQSLLNSNAIEQCIHGMPMLWRGTMKNGVHIETTAAICYINTTHAIRSYAEKLWGGGGVLSDLEILDIAVTQPSKSSRRSLTQEVFGVWQTDYPIPMPTHVQMWTPFRDYISESDTNTCQQQQQQQQQQLYVKYSTPMLRQTNPRFPQVMRALQSAP